MKVRDVMTEHVLTIEADAPVSQAHAWMRERAIRHLPVMRDGALVGVLSERDVFLLLSLSGVEAEGESVEEAMTDVPFSVGPDDALAAVTREMAARKYGCAVVVEGHRVVGILTAVDALRGLSDLLDALAPSEGRA